MDIKKHKNKRNIILFSAFLAFISCGGRQVSAQEEPLRAVIFYQSAIWVQDINVMHQIADSMQENLTEHPEVALSCYGIESLSVDQAVQAAVDMDTDVLFFYSIDSETALKSYARLKEEGIRLILVDGDLQTSGRFAYIGTDNYGAGEQALEAVAETMGTDCHVAVLAPALETSLCSVSARLAGFESAAAKRGLTIDARCETSYDSLTAIECIEELLDTHPHVDVLFCGEAVSGQAAADVVHERKLDEEIMVITYDRNSNIEDDLRSGALDLTFQQDTSAIGRACAKTLLELASDQSIQTGTDVFFDCIAVTPKTVAQEEGHEH